MGVCTSIPKAHLPEHHPPALNWAHESSHSPPLRSRDAFTGVLSHTTASALESSLPDAFRGRRWCRVFSLRVNGSSLGTLLRRCRGLTPTLLAVSSEHGEVFGAFLNDAWFEVGCPLGIHSSPDKQGFFGFGKSAFVFSAGTDGALHKFNVVPGLPPQYLRVRASRLGGVAALQLGVGGGGDAFAILLDEGLEKCTSGPCAAFASPPLAASSEPFRVLDVEVWAWAETDKELLIGQAPPAAAGARNEPESQRDEPLCVKPSLCAALDATSQRDETCCARDEL
jgi:hypothetical protein